MKDNSKVLPFTFTFQAKIIKLYYEQIETLSFIFNIIKTNHCWLNLARRKNTDELINQFIHKKREIAS